MREFTGCEAYQLRKTVATFKFTGGVSRFMDKAVSGMIRNGYAPEFAEKTFSQLKGVDRGRGSKPFNCSAPEVVLPQGSG